MQDAPDIEFRFSLGVEDQVREPPGRMETKAGNIQFMGITGRTDFRLFAEPAEGVFQGVDEGERYCLSGLGQIVLDGLIDITFRPFAQGNGFASRLVTQC